MSNNLLFQKAKSGVIPAFPCAWNQLQVETSGFPVEHCDEILTAMGAAKDRGGRYKLDMGDDGRLYVDLFGDSASIDMHVRPEIVIKIFESLKERDPYVMLFEMGDGHFHDVASYREFVKRNYEA